MYVIIYDPYEREIVGSVASKAEARRIVAELNAIENYFLFEKVEPYVCQKHRCFVKEQAEQIDQAAKIAEAERVDQLTRELLARCEAEEPVDVDPVAVAAFEKLLAEDRK